MISRVKEVALRAKALADALRKEGYDGHEITAGFLLAAQAAPAMEALESSQAAKRILQSAVNMVQEGMSLLSQIRTPK